MNRIIFVVLVSFFITATAWCEASKELLSLSPGEVTSGTAEGETGISYEIYTPTSFTAGNPPPVIIAFSPGGKAKQMIRAMKDSAEKAGWILVGCNKLKNGLEGNELAYQMEDELLDHLYSKLPHDPCRVYLAGFSGGAMRAYEISARRKERIAGIIAYGGWLGGQGYYDLEYCKYMAVAMVNGTNDSGANNWADKDEAVLDDRRCEVKQFSFDGKHQIAPSDVTDECIEWLEKEWLRHGSKKK